MIKNQLCLSLAALLLSACAATQSFFNSTALLKATSSPVAASPASVLLGATRERVATAMVDLNAALGSRVIFRNESGLVFAKPDSNAVGWVGGFSPTQESELRLKVDLSEEGKNTRAVITVFMAEHPNAPDEIVRDISATPKAEKEANRLIRQISALYPLSGPRPQQAHAGESS
jgi:hypothetical protein